MRLTFGTTAALAGKFFLPWPAFAQEAQGKAKSVILLWLQGGPSQIDTFDPKPGSDIGGPFGAIQTNVRGVFLGEHFKKLAKRMDKVSLIRTLHSKDPNHDTARYLLHTAYPKGDTVEHPHLGSMLCKELGVDAGGLPGCVSFGDAPAAGSGYLPPDLSPFIVEKLEKPMEDLSLPKGVGRRRLRERERLLEAQARKFLRKHRVPQVVHHKKAYERALAMMKSDNIKAFDYRKEPAKSRKRYPSTTFCRAGLVSRRLVETGVRFVEVMLGDWDTHAENFDRTEKLIHTLDPAFAALLDDLSERRMLDETLVMCMGEFGRTPKINGADGRDHFTRAWSVVLGGGGVHGGRVVGRTDALGMEIQDRPVSVQDLYATIYSCLGVDPEKEYRAQNGRPVKILDGGTPVKELIH